MLRIGYTVSFLFLWLICARVSAQKTDSLEALLRTPLHDTSRVKVLNQLGYIYLNIDSSTAVTYLTEALTTAEKMNYKKGRATALKNFGVAEEYAGNYRKALTYYEDALTIFKELQDPEGIADANNNFGVIYYLQGIYDKALFYYLEAERVYPKSLNSEFYSNILNNIGLIYDKQKQFDNALRYYHDALKIRLLSGQKLKISSSYNNIGLLYQGLHQLDSALYYHQKAMELRKDAGDLKGHGASLNNMGDIYLQKGNLTDALEAFNQALKLKIQSGDKRGQSFSYLGIAETYNRMKKYSSAIEAGNKALDIGRALDLREHLVNVLSTLSEAYEANGNYSASNKLLREALIYKDSIYEQEQQLNLAEMAVRFDLAKNELEKKELRKDVELKEEQLADSNTILKRQNMVIAGVSTALIGLIALLFMLRKTIRERDRINRELNKSTQNLNELNRIKDKLFSIISHDYRGPLTSVKSTLTLFDEGMLNADDQKMIIKSVKNEIDHTLNFLDNMLIWANSQFKGIEVNKTTFAVTDVIRNTVHLMLPQAEHKKIQIVIGNSEQLNVLADKEMTTLVLRNLLSNGVKFCSEGDMIEVFCSRKSNMAEIHVKDNGPGISKEKHEQLFRFEKAQSTYGTSNEKGVGLGLPLCKDFVERNGGTIELQSEPGKGADFYFTLPMG